MKRFVILFLLIFLISFVSSSACILDATLINQDPYPAVPNEYVKLVFQVTGLQNTNCRNVYFELIPNYPITLDPLTSTRVQIKGDTFVKDYSTNLQVPYKVRIDKDALNGYAPIDVKFSSDPTTGVFIQKQFDIFIEDVRADFEVHVRDYDLLKNNIEFEILNIGKNDIEALTIEIPEQENIQVRGSNRNIVGDLDSSDYTTTDFEATAQDGEIILNLIYTDTIGIRREKQETVYFNKSPFEQKSSNQTKTSFGSYIFILIILGAIGYYIYRRRKKKKQQKHLQHLQRN